MLVFLASAGCSSSSSSTTTTVPCKTDAVAHCALTSGGCYEWYTLDDASKYADYFRMAYPCWQLKVDDVRIQYAAMRISMKNPFAPVAFFPSDLSVPNTGSFMESVMSALDFVRRQSRLVLFGFPPDADTKPGELIEPDLNASLDSELGMMHVRRVSAHAEKSKAASLIEQGALVHRSRA